MPPGLRHFLRSRLPPPVLQAARWARAQLRSREAYALRVRQETSTYAGCEEVHDLPPIFHYWSNTYLRPKIAAFGFEHPDAFFAKYLAAALEDRGGDGARFLSLGAGNCDLEIRLAQALVASGATTFRIECLDLNEDMLRRGEQAARDAGVGNFIVPLRADFNHWRGSAQYDAIVANQSLHHVVELERLFDAVHDALAPHGRFVVSDMIGRNGHCRWPEAHAIVDAFWEELPESYRYNRQLRRLERKFGNWDCSVSGFEGIRAQDILPLLVERFGFDLFIGFANVIDPFIDRAFGGNFDAARDWDRAFIDRVHARDEEELCAGRIKPTHMFAVMRRGTGENRHLPALSPRDCIRWPDA